MALQSDRKWDRRLGLITSEIDFTGKRCLDLGCNRGFFSFGIAEQALSVLGIDADESFIQGNQRYARDNGIDTVEFTNASVTVDLILSLPEFDVVLMLSLLHHILAASEKYARFSVSGGIEYCVELLSAVASRTSTLVIEMGQSNEAYPWAPALPDMGSKPGNWIAENLLVPAGFSDITIASPTAYTGWMGPLRRAFSGRVVSKPKRVRFTGKRIVETTLRFDPRDIRPLIFAKAPQQSGLH